MTNRRGVPLSIPKEAVNQNDPVQFWTFTMPNNPMHVHPASSGRLEKAQIRFFVGRLGFFFSA